MPTENQSISKLLLTVALVAGAACATEPPPRPVQLDPSNPSAPESAPLSSGALAPAPSAPAPPPASSEPHEKTEAAPDGGPSRQQSTTLYTCAMHPEVISDKPGKCPKCGMTLVPKAPSENKP